jgi:acetyl-CoA carboxylase biotin carboxylase subunit
MEYDPLLAKMAVWAEDRAGAISRMLRALEEYSVGGIRTNVSFFRSIFADECFRLGELHTGFIDEFFARRAGAERESDAEAEAAAALVALLHTRKRQSARTATVEQRASRWRENRPLRGG